MATSDIQCKFIECEGVLINNKKLTNDGTKLVYGTDELQTAQTIKERVLTDNFINGEGSVNIGNDKNGGIELGTGNGSTPFIDFHTNSHSDYDIRIIAQKDNTLNFSVPSGICINNKWKLQIDSSGNLVFKYIG